MTQVVKILKVAGAKDLVLLDELGSGTDPEEGSALAVALLEYFRKRGPLMMVSTHYNELKRYAYHTDGIETDMWNSTNAHCVRPIDFISVWPAAVMP